MKFNVSTNELTKAVSTVSRAVSPKSTMSVLDCIYLSCENDQLKFMGSDGDITVVTYIPAKVYRPGSVIIPFRTLSDLIRTYKDADIDFDVDEKNVMSIKCGFSTVTILGRDSRDYPEFKTYKDKGITVKASSLIDMIRTTVFACAPQININPVLMGIFVECASNIIRFTALDGYKLAQRVYVNDLSIPEALSAIVPSKGMNEILKIVSAHNEDPSFIIKDKKFILNVEKTQIIVNLLEGVFINYDMLMPTDIKTTVEIDRQSLLTSVERASLITDETRNSLIKMDYIDNCLHIASNSDKGNVSDDIEINKKGEDIKIAFNARYFVEILKNIKDETIKIEFKDNNGPCLIKPTENEQFLYLVMPVKYID